MGSAMSRWSVSEYMRLRFMNTGYVPDLDELHTEFAGIDQTELREGIAEFETIAGVEVPYAKAN
ncbi:hypothetical protein AB9M62_57065 [Bacillales bacterium AN1005]